MTTIKNIRWEERILWGQNLARLLKAGYPLVASLEALAEGELNKDWQAIIREIAKTVTGGTTFSEALSQYPRVFPGEFVAAINVGERTDGLVPVLTRFADQWKLHEDTRRQLVSASLYPVLLFIVALAVTAFLLTAVVPRLTLLHSDMGTSLPRPTRILVKISDGLLVWKWFVLGIVTAIGAGLAWLWGHERGRVWRDQMLDRLPGIGPLWREARTASLMRTWATLVGTGMPLPEMLEVTLPLVPEGRWRESLKAVHHAVVGGEGLAKALGRTEWCTPLALSLIRIGAQTNALAEAFSTVAEVSDAHVQVRTKRLLSLVEPLLLLMMAVLIGSLLVAMYLPIFALRASPY